MLTVEKANKSFSDKKLEISLPYPADWKVKDLQVVEKKDYIDKVGVLLAVRVVDNEGREVSDLLFFESPVERPKTRPKARIILDPLKDNLLPARELMAFDSDRDAFDYILNAMDHLLRDKGYQEASSPVSGIWMYQKEKEKSFFFGIALRCGDEAAERADVILDQRKNQAPDNDYALVLPAIQEMLDVPLYIQEAWISKHNTRFADNRLCLLGVDCLDPNRIYSFSVYPRSRELMKYFMITTRQWPMIREQYVLNRSK